MNGRGGGWDQGREPVETKQVKAKEKAKDIESHRVKIKRLKDEEVKIENRLVSLDKEIKQAHASHLADIKQAKIALSAKNKKLNILIHDNEVLRAKFNKSIEENVSRLTLIDDRLKELDRQTQSGRKWKKGEEERLKAEEAKLNLRRDNLISINQGFSQARFRLLKQQAEINEQSANIKEEQDKAEQQKADTRSEKEVLQLDQKFANESLEKAKKLRREAWAIKEAAEDLMKRATDKMADATRKEEANKKTSAQLKQQKAKQDEREDELDLQEKANKKEAARLANKRELLKKVR